MRTLSNYFVPSVFRTDPFFMSDRMMDEFWGREDMNDNRRSQFSPEVDIEENAGNYLLSFDLPGLKKEDIQIEVKDNILTVSGERKWETKEETNNLKRFERKYGSFSRSFTLPTSVDANRVEANYENGVLELALPKSEAAKSKKVEIQSGKGGLFSKLVGSKEKPTPSSDH
ncbi:MAG: Hsp20/alpha crystallin family protein [Pseudobdellovibrionaceae bacterium]